jgi:hypothetical protein
MDVVDTGDRITVAGPTDDRQRDIGRASMTGSGNFDVFEVMAINYRFDRRAHSACGGTVFIYSSEFEMPCGVLDYEIEDGLELGIAWGSRHTHSDLPHGFGGTRDARPPGESGRLHP